MNYFNLSYIFLAPIILSIYYYLNIKIGNYFSISDIFGAYFLGSTLLLLPEKITSIYKDSKNYLLDKNILTILQVIVISLIGLLLSKHLLILNISIIIIGCYLLIDYLRNREVYRISIIKLTSVSFLILLIILTPMSIGYTSVFFQQGISTSLLLGGTDTLFHMSTSNMINSYGIPSAGLDGIPHFHYHWFSHLVAGGFSSFVNNNMVAYYNIIFHIIFVPILLKSIYSICIKLTRHYNWGEINLFLMVFIFFITSPFFWANFYITANSYCLSLIIAFNLSSFIINKKNIFNSFYLLSIIFLGFILMTLTKVSTGFIFAFFTGYIALRNCRKPFDYIKLIILSFIYIAIIYLYFLKIRDTSHSSFSIYDFINNFLIIFKFIPHFYDAFWGVIIGGLFIYFKEKKILCKKENIIFESLVITNIFSIILGVILTKQYMPDAMNFLSVHIFLCIPLSILLIKFFLKEKNKFNNNYLVNYVALGFITLFGITNHQTFKTYSTNKIIYQKNMKKQYNFILDTYIKELIKLNTHITDKKNYCIFIEKNQKWYYKDFSSCFVTPAFSGIAHIGGISEKNIGEKKFSFDTYSKEKNFDKMNINDAMDRAREKGFKKIIYFYSSNNYLIRKTYNL